MSHESSLHEGFLEPGGRNFVFFPSSDPERIPCRTGLLVASAWQQCPIAIFHSTLETI